MSEVQDHYCNLLAKHYTWMFGTPFAVKVNEQKAILEDALQPTADNVDLGLALDLGSGPGFQTFALAEMGYSPVLAVDTSESLLKELQSQQGNRSVQTICSDLSKLGEFVSPATAQVIVCMGDTITHLGSKDAVEELLRSVVDTLIPGGKFVISYRDLSAEATGLDRFIPVYADEGKVMTCFLEFDRSDAVLVHDLVYSRAAGALALELAHPRTSGYDEYTGKPSRLSLPTGARDFEHAFEDPRGYQPGCSTYHKSVSLVLGQQPAS